MAETQTGLGGLPEMTGYLGHVSVFALICVSHLAVAKAGGEICVVGPVSNDVLHDVPVTIIIEDSESFRLSGGDIICADVTVGTHVVRAESADPYNSSSASPIAWKAAPLAVDVKSATKVGIELEGIGKHGRYSGWRLQTLEDAINEGEAALRRIERTSGHSPFREE